MGDGTIGLNHQLRLLNHVNAFQITNTMLKEDPHTRSGSTY